MVMVGLFVNEVGGGCWLFWNGVVMKWVDCVIGYKV